MATAANMPLASRRCRLDQGDVAVRADRGRPCPDQGRSRRPSPGRAPATARSGRSGSACGSSRWRSCTAASRTALGRPRGRTRRWDRRTRRRCRPSGRCRRWPTAGRRPPGGPRGPGRGAAIARRAGVRPPAARCRSRGPVLRAAAGVGTPLGVAGDLAGWHVLGAGVHERDVAPGDGGLGARTCGRAGCGLAGVRSSHRPVAAVRLGRGSRAAQPVRTGPPGGPGCARGWLDRSAEQRPEPAGRCRSRRGRPAEGAPSGRVMTTATTSGGDQDPADRSASARTTCAPCGMVDSGFALADGLARERERPLG